MGQFDDVIALLRKQRKEVRQDIRDAENGRRKQLNLNGRTVMDESAELIRLSKEQIASLDKLIAIYEKRNA